MPSAPDQDIADDVRDWLMSRLPEAGLDNDTAHLLADELESWLRSQYGTGRHYVRSGTRRSARLDIQRDWRRGYTVREIAQRNGVTTQYVYRVIRDDRPSLGRQDWERRG